MLSSTRSGNNLFVALYVCGNGTCLQRCSDTGEDFDLVKLRNLGADEAGKWERRKKKKNPDPGFAGKVCPPCCYHLLSSFSITVFAIVGCSLET